MRLLVLPVLLLASVLLLSIPGVAFTVSISSTGVMNPVSTGQALTMNPHRNKPAAMYFNGTTYIVFAGGTPMDPYIIAYNHTAETWAGPVKVGEHDQSDIHGSPSVMVAQNGTIHVFWGGIDEPGRHAFSASPENISAWSARDDVTPTNSNYHQILRLENGTSDNYLHGYRKTSGSSRTAVIRISEDNMVTWGAERTLVDFGDYWIYPNYFYDEQRDRLHVFWFWYDFPTDYEEEIYHAYYNIADDTMYAMDGTDLGATVNRTEADANALVYNATTRGGGSIDMDFNMDGNPYFIFQQEDTTDGWARMFGYWDGSSYVTEELDTDGQTIAGTFEFIDNWNAISLMGDVRDGNVYRWAWSSFTGVWTNVSLVQANQFGDDIYHPTRVTDAETAEETTYNTTIRIVFAERDPDDFGNADLPVYTWGQDAIPTFQEESYSWLIQYGPNWVALLVGVVIFGLIFSSFWVGIKKRKRWRRKGKIWRYMPRKFR